MYIEPCTKTLLLVPSGGHHHRGAKSLRRAQGLRWRPVQKDLEPGAKTLLLGDGGHHLGRGAESLCTALYTYIILLLRSFAHAADPYII